MLDADVSSFEPPGCYDGCVVQSGRVCTIIPAKKIEAKTYVFENECGDAHENYCRKGNEK